MGTSAIFCNYERIMASVSHRVCDSYELEAISKQVKTKPY
jgi:hypothetical protein